MALGVLSSAAVALLTFFVITPNQRVIRSQDWRPAIGETVMRVLQLALIFIALIPTIPMTQAQQIPPFESIRRDTPVDRAWRDVNEGDTKAEVIEKAGKPDHVEPGNEESGECWTWAGLNMTVYLVFEGDIVKSKTLAII